MSYGLTCHTLIIWLLISSLHRWETFLKILKWQVKIKHSPSCTFQPLITSGCLDMKKTCSAQYSRKAADLDTSSFCSACVLGRNHRLRCYEEQLPLRVSFCHSRCSFVQPTRPVIRHPSFWRGMIHNGSEHCGYLCQLTILQLLLFPLQESRVTSDHSPDHVYMLPLMASVGDTPLLPRYDPHNAVFSLHVLLISLSAHGRLISLAEKQQRI